MRLCTLRTSITRCPRAGQSACALRGGVEELEVRSPTGEIEVRVAFTEAGPVLHLRAASIELEAADAVSLECRRLEVRTTEEVHLHSDEQIRLTGQEMRVRTEGDVHLNGDVIRLNC